MDQASGLRELVRRGKEALPEDRRPGRARVVAITSGKGGVGKTNVCVNLALALAERGRRVTLFDADLGLANLDIVLGLSPEWTLAHVVAGQRTVREILLDGPGGIRVVPAGSGVREMADLSSRDRAAVMDALGELESGTDWLLVDTGAGLSANVLMFLASADEILVVTTPEPTSLLDAYGVVKAYAAEHPRGTVRIVVNQAASKADADEVFERLRGAAEQFLRFPLHDLGFVLRDHRLPDAVRRQRPLLLAYPDAPSARCFRLLARSLDGTSPPAASAGFFRGVAAWLRARTA